MLFDQNNVKNMAFVHCLLNTIGFTLKKRTKEKCAELLMAIATQNVSTIGMAQYGITEKQSSSYAQCTCIISGIQLKIMHIDCISEGNLHKNKTAA